MSATRRGFLGLLGGAAALAGAGPARLAQVAMPAADLADEPLLCMVSDDGGLSWRVLHPARNLLEALRETADRDTTGRMVRIEDIEATDSRGPVIWEPELGLFVMAVRP